jgi:hypothetical protein
LLATLIGATSAEIGPEVVVTARVNEMACAGNETRGSGRSGDGDAGDEPLDRTLVPDGLCLLVELAVAFGTGEALDESVPRLGGAWSRLSDAAFGRVMDAAMTTAAPTTPAKRTLRMATTAS